MKWYQTIEYRDVYSAVTSKINTVCIGVCHHPNAEFIAHARTDIPRLVAEVEHLQRELAASKDAVKCASPGPPVEYIELNMSNFDDDDVARLNEWAIWANTEIERLQAELAAAKRVAAHSVRYHL